MGLKEIIDNVKSDSSAVAQATEKAAAIAAPSVSKTADSRHRVFFMFLLLFL